MSQAATLRRSAGAITLLPPITRRAAVVFGVAAVVLLIPWPGGGRVFRTLFSGYADAVLAVTGAGGAAEPEFLANPPAGAAPEATSWTVWVHATRGPRADQPALPLDTRILGYTPLALLLALVCASQVPWRRRAELFALGSSLLLLRLAVAIAMAVGRGLGAHRTAAGPVAEIVWYVVIDSPAVTYVAPLAAWAVALALTETRARRRRVSPNRT